MASHMIVTDLGSDNGKQGLHDMDDMVREGVASFKLFMAYPNVLMVDDGTIFKALRQTAKNGALVCMHAENGSAIDALSNRRLRRVRRLPIYHCADADERRPKRRPCTGRLLWLRWLAVLVYIVHLSSEDALNQVREARDRGLPAFAETCPQYLLLSIEDQMPGKSFDEAKYVYSSALREKKNQSKLWDGLVHGQFTGGFDRPLPVLLCRPEAAGQRRLHQDSQRRSRRREPHAVAVSLWSECRADLAAKICRDYLHGTGANLGMYPKKGTPGCWF